MDTKKRMAATTMNIMKYFTREWCFGDLSDKQIKEISQSYDNYINRVYAKLLFSLRLLAKNINLHDGIIKKLTLSRSRQNLALFGTFGDLESGYFNLKIEYIGIKNFDSDAVFKMFAKEKMEVVRDELGIFENNSDLVFIHRFIFSNKSEFQIEFCDCRLKIENTNANDYVKKFCMLIGF